MLTLNQIITMYKDSNNVIYIQDLINGAIMIYRKHGIQALTRYIHSAIGAFGVTACSDLETLVLGLDPAIVSLNYVEGEE